MAGRVSFRSRVDGEESQASERRSRTLHRIPRPSYAASRLRRLGMTLRPGPRRLAHKKSGGHSAAAPGSWRRLLVAVPRPDETVVVLIVGRHPVVDVVLLGLGQASPVGGVLRGEER